MLMNAGKGRGKRFLELPNHQKVQDELTEPAKDNGGHLKQRRLLQAGKRQRQEEGDKGEQGQLVDAAAGQTGGGAAHPAGQEVFLEGVAAEEALERLILLLMLVQSCRRPVGEIALGGSWGGAEELARRLGHHHVEDQQIAEEVDGNGEEEELREQAGKEEVRQLAQFEFCVDAKEVGGERRWRWRWW